MNALASTRPARRIRRRRQGVVLLAAAVVVLGGLCAPSEAQAQLGRRRSVPEQTYYLGFPAFYAGEFSDALKIFNDAGRSGVRSTEGLWIDSVCYFTMKGECLYQLGQNAQALECYDAALKLSMLHQGWMLRIQFPEAIQPDTRANSNPITWGASNRRIVVGRIPDKLGTLQGRINNDRAIQQGGVVTPAQIYSLDVQEINRCIAVSLRRRMEIMGPTCEHHPLTAQLVQSLSKQTLRPGHWAQPWLDCQLGLAYASAGKFPQAISELQKSLVIAGQFDHALTPLALLVVGELALEQENFAMATEYFAEATYSAAMQSQFDVMEEAFRGALTAHIVSGQPGPFAALEPATAWASRGSRRSSRFLASSLLVMAAENYAAAGEPAKAADLLAQARREIGRGDATGRLGARYQYQSAYVQFQAGDVSAGAAAFANAMKFQQASSLRLYQTTLADEISVSGAVTDRVASLLYAEVLREPTPRDWSFAPLETMSVVTTPNLSVLENWFDVALKRKEYDTALEIADRIRRARFYSTLPMGGRLLALRWILAAPESTLSPSALLQRQTLLVKRPRLGELLQRSEAIRAELAGLPWSVDNPDAARQQAELFSQFGKLSAAQESMLREIALSRQPSEFVFPPPLNIKEFQAALPEGRLVLAYFLTSRALHGFAIAKGDYAYWRIESPPNVRKNLVNLLRGIGQVEQNYEVDLATLRNNEWRVAARELIQALTGSMKAEDWKKYDEVVIIPDGPLWYTPFEALQIGADDDLAPLISKLRVRYAPTVALAAPDGRRLPAMASTSVVVGALFPRDGAEIGDAAFKDLQDVLPRANRVPEKLPAGSNLLAALTDRVVVLSDLDNGDLEPYSWAPMPSTPSGSAATLDTWISLPWEGPQQIVLPGFHTQAENALKRNGNGAEVFLSVCGLMASGSRTILLSRWRTAGPSSYNLVREFLQELPFSDAAGAWRRAVHVGMSGELDPVAEPRVKDEPLVEPLKTDHPFFWSGYMLIDTGGVPLSDMPPADPAAPADANAAPPANAENNDAP